MASRWFSWRAIRIHLLTLVWVLGCIAATVWQATRAMDGNSLSYLYVVEWPVFVGAGIFGWWTLLHQDPPTKEERAQRNEIAQSARSASQAAKRRPEEEDEQLRAYNDHLARLAGTTNATPTDPSDGRSTSD